MLWRLDEVDVVLGTSGEARISLSIGSNITLKTMYGPLDTKR
jgi:hypothetical protein